MDEDFTLTRQLARGNLQSMDDLRAVFLPLLPIQSRKDFEASHYDDLLRARLKEVTPEVVDAFIGPAAPADIAHMLETGK